MVDTERDESPWHRDWLTFTDREYYWRCRNILINSGVGEGDTEMILANFWEAGWLAGCNHNNKHAR
jgi:hypothetical protein